MSFSALFLSLSLLSPAAADTSKAPKPRPEAPAYRPPVVRAPGTSGGTTTAKPLPLGEPRLKRRKPPM